MTFMRACEGASRSLKYRTPSGRNTMKTVQTLASAAVALSLAFGLAAEASAHAKLVKSDPAQNGQSTDKKNMELTFSEEISGKLSGAVLTDAKGAKVATTAM